MVRLVGAAATVAHRRSPYDPAVVPEAKLEQTDVGLVPAGAGWFVLNARDGRWFHKPGRGDSIPLTGCDEYEAETFFPMLGMAIRVLGPGEPNGRVLRQWDVVYCPPETRHVFVGAGEGPCVILAASSRQFQKDGPWGFYSVDETAARYNASSPEETQDGDVAYARFAPSQKVRYPGGLLPGDQS